MISKKRALIYSIILVIVTIIGTTMFQITLGNKVIISKDLYESYAKYNKLLGLEELIQEDYYKEVSGNNLVDGALKGLFEGLNDPYSQYYTADEFESLKEQTSGSFVGIGVYIGVNPENNKLTIISPIEGSPADKAGVKSGDIVLKVDGESVETKKIDDVIKNIKGKENTDVSLTVQRKEQELSFDIKRETIVTKSVSNEVMDNNIGYLRIKSFDENTHKEFKENLSVLESKGVKGLVIDLRDNPGGLLDVCVDIADDLIGKGTIVYTKDNTGNKEYYKSDDKQVDMPIAVLINGGSASASEILTAALVDNNKAIAIGETSFGKGLVQSVKGLKDGTGYKLTTAQYFTPNGDYINGKGITPKIKETNENQQLKSALEYIKKEIK
ncbi:S41 family peptidase [Terrisporobacter petrolearius]|uniref:S41 family peptidase n=1 Tax=Terrisporobacter petrolearius TaxID=1460447 RepID=UPI001D16C3C9|nr:S41 family peptidase [Terrisporobacter petrolearius]MCC3864293.1 S41 family peptidase [Terrisporobacter petrolearius]